MPAVEVRVDAMASALQALVTEGVAAWRASSIVAYALWVVTTAVGVGMMYYVRCRRAGRRGAMGWYAATSGGDVEHRKMQPGTTRMQRGNVVVTNVMRVAAMPVVRSVDIQPLPVATRVQRVDAAMPTKDLGGANNNVNLNADATMPRPTRKQAHPCISSHEKMTTRSFREEYRVQSASSCNATSVGKQNHERTRISLPSITKGRTGAIMALWAFAILSVATAEKHSNPTALTASSATEWYIVLASIPVLDKVLPLKNLAAELLQRGYRVGFALPENCRHWVSDLEQLEFISLGDIVGSGHPVHPNVGDLEAFGVYDSYFSTLHYYASFQRPMYGVLLEDLEDDRPHLVIMDRHTFAAFDVCHALSIPYVVNNPSLLLDMDSPPMYIPAPFSNLTMHTTSSMDRCLNVFYRLRFRLVMIKLFKDINQVRRDNGLPLIASKDAIIGNRLVLVNSAFGLDDPRPMAPQYQMVGTLEPSAAVQETTELPEDFEHWLKTETLGPPVIFISFHPDMPLSPEFVKILMNGLESIPARLVWRITLQAQAAFDLRSRARSSVYFLGKNADEGPILSKAPIALLISPGDSFTLQRALGRGIPTLSIPFSAEQWEVANSVVRAGAGLHLGGSSFSVEGVQNAVQHLLDNSHFIDDATYLGQLLQLGGGVKRAADHIASVLESGPQHLVPNKHLQPFYRAYFVDVYLMYGGMLCVAAVVLRMVFSVFYSIVQIAPEVHLGVTLDGPEDPDATVDVHKTPSL